MLIVSLPASHWMQSLKTISLATRLIPIRSLMPSRGECVKFFRGVSMNWRISVSTAVPSIVLDTDSGKTFREDHPLENPEIPVLHV